jgi:AmmeMemoRadiSam system protein A
VIDEDKGVEHFPPRLARETLEAYLGEKRTITPPPDTPTRFQQRAGVFVTLHKQGHLRGCIGTFVPQQPSIAHEIIANAISSATHDPRFPAVGQSELASITISVDVLSTPKRVVSLDELDPRRFGVIVSKDWQRGLLLPDLPGVDSIEQQLSIAQDKAGLSGIPVKQLTIERFTVTRYEE